MSDEYKVEDELLTVYLAYNGFNRPALVMGVPIMILLPLMFVAFFGGFIGFSFYGLKGLMPAGFSLLSIIVIRGMTENDPNALSLVSLKVKGFMIRKFSSIVAVRGR